MEERRLLCNETEIFLSLKSGKCLSCKLEEKGNKVSTIQLHRYVIAVRNQFVDKLPITSN